MININNKKQQNIPKGWQRKRLCEVGKFSKGTGALKSDLVIEGNNVVRYGELYTRFQYKIKNIYSFIPNKAIDKSKKIKFGDILFAGSGETIEEIGKSATYLLKEDCYAGGDIIIFSPKKENSLFLSYLLNIGDARKELSRLGQGQSVVHIYKSGLERIAIILPPLPEQKQIVKILETWDKCLEKLSRKIEVKKNIKKGLASRIMNCELSIINGKKVYAPKVRLVGFSGEWEKIEFDQCLNVLKKPKGLKSQDYEVLGYPIIDQSDNKYISGYTNKLEYIYDYSLSKSVILFGDHSRTLKYINQKVAFGNDGIKLFQAKDGFNTKFMYFKLLIQKVPNTGYNRHFKYLKDEIFKLPTLKEQQAIAEILTTADKEIEVLEKKKKIIEDQKKYLLNNLVTGKIRIPSFVIPA